MNLQNKISPISVYNPVGPSIPVECPSPLSAGELVLLLDRHLLPNPIALLPNLPAGFVWHPLVTLFGKEVITETKTKSTTSPQVTI